MVRNGLNHDGKSNDKIVNRTVFKDGSELVEFEGGSIMVVESGLAKAQAGAEAARHLQPARHDKTVRYDQPAPPPPGDFP